MSKVSEILDACGYPTQTVVLDCESYFDAKYTLSKLSTYEYVCDKRFEELGWAVKVGGMQSRFVRKLPSLDWNRVTVVMQNAPFDALVLAKHHQLYPPYIVDILDLARHIEPRWSNSLADLCKRHGLIDKGDTKQFLGLHCNPDDIRWPALREYAINDAEREYDLLKLLLPKLSNPKFELEIATWTRNLFIRPVLRLNSKRAEQLKTNMNAEMKSALDKVSLSEKEVRSEDKFRAKLVEALGNELLPTKQGKKKRLLAIAKTDPGYEYLLHHPNERVRQLMEARVAAKSWPLHAKRITKLQHISDSAGGGLLPIPLKYCGCHTGRWAGGGGINLQNLTARGHELAVKIRTLIEAPPGYTLVIIDLAQIEARTLDWLSEQNDMLRAFAEGRDLYCEFASKLTGHKIRKPRKTDNKAIAKWYGNYRTFGKVGTLGAGYGMGVDHCITFAKNTYHVDLDYAMGKKIIDLYRNTHRNVCRYWTNVERAFRMATQTGQRYELPYKIRFYREDNATIIELPTGRRLTYTGARVAGTADRPQLVMPNPASPKNNIQFWGGYLVENIVQAVSRDILAEMILNIEKLGLRIPLTVHDDVSIIVPIDEVDTYRPQLEAIAKTPPVWAKELPIDIDCKVSREYCK